MGLLPVSTRRDNESVSGVSSGPGPSNGGVRPAEEDLGRAFEAENALADLERWRSASDAERGHAIAELMEYAERVAASSGIRNDEPAKRLPTPRTRPAG